jgi:hypothetical protein
MPQRVLVCAGSDTSMPALGSSSQLVPPISCRATDWAAHSLIRKTLQFRLYSSIFPFPFRFCF